MEDCNDIHLKIVAEYVKKLSVVAQEMYQFGENKNLCNYDRIPPDLEKRNLNETDKENYKFQYNYWKNIFQYSVSQRIKLMKQDMTPEEEDEYCRNLATILSPCTSQESKPLPKN